MIFIRGIIFLFLILVLPLLLGIPLASLLDLCEDRRIFRVPFSYLIGWLLIFAEFQLLAVPFVLNNKTLTSLIIAMGISLAWTLFLLWFFAARHANATSKTILTRGFFGKLRDWFKNRKGLILIVEIAALILFLYMLSQYVFKMHIDADDSRFIANASLAYEHDEMFQYDWGTGIHDTSAYSEINKDLPSPWVMIYAVIGRLTMTNPAIIAHKLMAPILFILCMISYYLLADAWMKRDRVKIAWFMLFAGIVLLTFGGNTHTEAVVSLVRIWQGKAVVAAVAIPVLYALYGWLCHSDDDSFRKRVYCLFLITCQASCLLSGVGIIVSGLVTGPFCLWDILCKKRWKELPLLLICCVPTLVYGLIYAKL